MRVSMKLPHRTVAVSGIVLGSVVALSSLAVVRAERVQSDKSKTFSCSAGYACLQAKSSGSSTAAIFAAITNGSSNEAIYGQADNGTGVLGTAYNGYGMIGEGPLAGVFGEATGLGSSSAPGLYGYTTNAGAGTVGVNSGGSGPGVYGVSSSGYGVQAYSYSSAGLYAEAAENGPVLQGRGDGSYTDLFYAYNAATGGYCGIDYLADLGCTGVITGALRGLHRNSAHQRVLTYASESVGASIEDTGEARTFDGVANVMISSDFASVIDRTSNYYVFLTPLGDTRGLYVSMKTPSGFQVRENERGRTNVMFDYRIVARPIDVSADRLPPAPRMKRVHRNVRPQLPPLPKLAQ